MVLEFWLVEDVVVVADQRCFYWGGHLVLVGRGLVRAGDWVVGKEVIWACLGLGESYFVDVEADCGGFGLVSSQAR